MSCGAADQTAENISPAFVRRHDAVADHKGGGTNMIGNQTHGHIHRILLLILHPCNFTDSVTNCFHGVNIKYGIHILHHYCQTLQPHAGINIFLGKLLVITLAVTLKLGKHIIPYFHKAVTVTPHLTVRLAAAVFDTSVIVNFGTGTARACAMLPEVIAVTVLVPVKSGNLLRRHTDLLVPDFKRLVIFTVNGGIEPLRIHTDDFGQELPAPCNSLMLKIVTKGKITQHLKKSKMTGRLAHILNIPRAHTFLAGGNPFLGRNLLPRKIRL